MYYERLMQVTGMAKQAGDTSWIYDLLGKTGRLFSGKLDKQLNTVGRKIDKFKKGVPAGADVNALKKSYEDAKKAWGPLQQEYNSSMSAADNMNLDFLSRTGKDAVAAQAYKNFYSKMNDFMNPTAAYSKRAYNKLINSVPGLSSDELDAFFKATRKVRALEGQTDTALANLKAARDAYMPSRRLANALSAQEMLQDRAALRGGLILGGTAAAGGLGLAMSGSGSGSQAAGGTYNY